MLPISHDRNRIIISEFLERHSNAKRTRAPAYSRALRRIKGAFHESNINKLCRNLLYKHYEYFHKIKYTPCLGSHLQGITSRGRTVPPPPSLGVVCCLTTLFHITDD